MHEHLPSFLMNEPELWAHTEPLCPAKWTNEGGAHPNFPPACKGTWIQTANLWKTGQGETATYLQGWAGSSGSSRSRPGGHIGRKPYTLIRVAPACPALAGGGGGGVGWGVGSKLNHTIPALHQGGSKTFYWDEHTLENLKSYPSTTVSIKATKPRILEFPPKRQRSIPA